MEQPLRVHRRCEHHWLLTQRSQLSKEAHQKVLGPKSLQLATRGGKTLNFVVSVRPGSTVLKSG
jgi:hypothetical protein